MGNRRSVAPRCARCQLLQASCICASIPVLHSQISIALVLDHREAMKPTNTGQLACLALPDSKIFIRGLREQSQTSDGVAQLTSMPATSLADLCGESRNVVLYPSEDAETLSEEWLARDPRKVTLFVPDGTWSQASRMVRREPALSGLQRVKLGDGVTGARLQVRHPTREDGFATIEAIAAAFGALGELDNELALRALYDLFARSVLASRGALQL